MKTLVTLRNSLFLATGLALTATTALANHHGEKKPPATNQSEAAYPLTTCVVSGDKLEDGDMGPPVDYIHKEAGQPDRLVRLCCKGCLKSFKKAPAKYLKMIDAAAAAKTTGEKSASKDGHAH
jgi:hypothetical protein